MGLIEGAEEAGLNAVTGGVGGTALALLKRYWKPALLVIAALVIILSVIAHFGNDRHTRKERDGLQAWQTAVLAVTRTATGDKTLQASDVVAQIQRIEAERAGCANALAEQSAALTQAKGEATAAQNNAVEAENRAAQRDQDRAATQAALTNPKRTTGLTAAEWGKL